MLAHIIRTDLGQYRTPEGHDSPRRQDAAEYATLALAFLAMQSSRDRIQELDTEPPQERDRLPS